MIPQQSHNTFFVGSVATVAIFLAIFASPSCDPSRSNEDQQCDGCRNLYF
jgi:hypothetical protein